MAEITSRYAVVTGGNKGIGLEVCRQLMSQGITVVLTARDEAKGVEAVAKLSKSASAAVLFHRLDVNDLQTIASLAQFIKSQFEKLDILLGGWGPVFYITSFWAVSAPISFQSIGILGSILPDEAQGGCEIGSFDWIGLLGQSYELATECVETNYRGAKRLTEALLPLLHLSHSPRIVNVSSLMGKLKYIPSNKWAEGMFNDVENLTEERIDEVVNVFLEDFKEGSLEAKGWPGQAGAYIVSKAAMNAYTRLLAKQYPNFRINCVCPGYVKTDINFNLGFLTVEEGAESPVRLALLPDDGPSGMFFSKKELVSFE